MLIAALKCDFCQKTQEITNGAGKAQPAIPDGWATITSMVHIKGMPHNPDRGNGKLFRERRDKLRARFQKSHICEDCIELTLTGKNTLKITQEMKQA